MEAAGSDTRSTLTSAAIIRTSYAMAKACESDFTPWDPGKSASGTSPTKARYRSSEHRRAAAHTRRALFVCQRSGVLLLLPPSAPFPNNVSCCQQLKDWIQVSGQLLRRSASFRMPPLPAEPPVLFSLLGCFCDNSSLPSWRAAYAATARTPKLRAGSRFLNAPAAPDVTPSKAGAALWDRT